tara:strand:- start:230702 stop:231676 length:975 start_codon:yes stop_codon:yes gene_type:complete
MNKKQAIRGHMGQQNNSKIQEQLSKRSKDQNKNFFTDDLSQTIQTHFLTSRSDLGVIRNGGKLGSRYAPEAILNCFKKLIHNPHSGSYKVTDVFPPKEKEIQFNEAQSESINKIKESLKTKSSNLVHLGGGHDHIYPLLMAFNSAESLKKMNKKNIHIINIDAHLDTRREDEPHSGTPFRQFMDRAKVPVKLTQIGIHHFANASSNFDEIEMNVITMNEIDDIFNETNFVESWQNKLSEVIPYDKDTLYIFSLDCDGLDSSIMKAVSATNHHGIDHRTFSLTYKYFQTQLSPDFKIIGIYEYNPIYDDLTQSCCRYLAQFIESI